VCEKARERERVEGESKGTQEREREIQEGWQSERGLGEISSLADE